MRQHSVGASPPETRTAGTTISGEPNTMTLQNIVQGTIDSLNTGAPEHKPTVDG